MAGREGGMGLLAFETRLTCLSQQATDHSPIPLEGRGRANDGVQTVPIDSALWEGWLSHHSTHF